MMAEVRPFSEWRLAELNDHYSMFLDMPRLRYGHEDEVAEVYAELKRRYDARAI